MKLTNEAESILLAQYDNLLRREVRLFQRRHLISDTEDLLQEARLAFLCHIRQIESEKDILPFKKQIFSRLYTYKRRMAIVYIPHYAFKSEIGHYTREDIDYEALADPNSEDATVEIVFKEFIASLSPTEREALIRKLKGCRNVDLMELFDVRHDMQVSRIMKRLQGELRRTLYGE